LKAAKFYTKTHAKETNRRQNQTRKKWGRRRTVMREKDKTVYVSISDEDKSGKKKGERKGAEEKGRFVRP